MPRWLLLAGLVGGNFLVVLDVSILNIALPDIRDDLHASAAVLPWVVDAYTVVFAGMLLAAGSLADRYGPRRVYLTSIILFAAFSIICAAATTPAVLIGGRALQGAAAAGLVPASLALLASHFPDTAERSRVIGVWAAMSSVGFALGPVAGGALIELSGWRLIFLINPIVTAIVVLLGRSLSRARPSDFRQLDIAGLVLSMCCLASVTFAIIHAGVAGWTSVGSVSAFALGLTLLTVLVVVERRAEVPAVPPQLLASPRVIADMAAVAVAAFAFYGCLFGLTIWMVTEKGMSPLHTGLAFLPMTLPMCILPFITGRLIARYGTQRVIFGGIVISILGSVGLIFADASTSYAIAVALGTFLAIGGTLTIPATTADISMSAPKAVAATAQGAQGAARQTGVVLGIAAMATVDSPRGIGAIASAVTGLGLIAVLALWNRSRVGDELAEPTPRSAVASSSAPQTRLLRADRPVEGSDGAPGFSISYHK